MTITVAVGADGTLAITFGEVQPAAVNWGHAILDMATLATDLVGTAPTPGPTGATGPAAMPGTAGQFQASRR